MADPLRVLCTGDLHVGRRPSRLADGVDARAWSCAAVWNDIVDYALRQRIDLVLVSGDWVDHDNRFYEAFGPIERGLRRLADAGIDTVAVAGNHDYDVLPRLAAHLAGEGGGRFRLLGRDGRWERCTIRRDGRTPVHVDGWSFPRERVLDNPMREYRAGPGGDGVPVVALLHADLDQPHSCYAPVAMSDLRATPVTLWLLGHVHACKLYDSTPGPLVLYPGSPQAMDPGEPDAHGPWLVVLGEGKPRVEHLPMSKVRYDRVAVDVTGVGDEAALGARLLAAVGAHAGRLADACGPLEYASVRLVLTGRCRLHRRMRACCEPVREQLDLRPGNFRVRVERIDVDTRPAFDLKQLAHNNDAPGVLARILLGLESSDPGEPGSPDALAGDVLQRLADLCGGKAYRNLADDPPDPAAVRALLARQGYLLLDQLLAQREADDDGGAEAFGAEAAGEVAGR